MEPSEEQNAKAPSPMEVRVAGKVTETREEQSLKALLPMETRLRGKATEKREVRPWNAPPVRQVRHAFGQHRVPARDDHLPIVVQAHNLVAGRRRGAARRRRRLLNRGGLHLRIH